MRLLMCMIIPLSSNALLLLILSVLSHVRHIMTISRYLLLAISVSLFFVYVYIRITTFPYVMQARKCFDFDSVFIMAAMCERFENENGFWESRSAPASDLRSWIAG